MISGAWRIVSWIRRFIFSIILILSLLFNIGLLLSDALFTLASGAVGVVTGVRSLVVRQTDTIADQSAKLAAEKRVTRELRSELAETTLQLNNSRVAMQQVKEAAQNTAERITRRTRKGALRDVAAMPGEAIPFWGTAVIVGATSLEIADMCATMIDMTELQRLFEPDIEAPEDQLTVCSLEIPTKSEIFEMARTAPRQVWDNTKEMIPTIEELGDFELPDLDWVSLRSSIVDKSSNWSDTAKGVVNNKLDQLGNWWNE